MLSYEAHIIRRTAQMVHIIDIVGAGATPDGLSRTVKGTVRIDTGSASMDRAVKAILDDVTAQMFLLVSHTRVQKRPRARAETR